MKKKSLLAMGLAGIMTIGMCVPVLAEDTSIDQSTSSKTGNTDVKYNITSAYKVTIPAEITLSDNASTINFSGTTGNINEKEVVNIKILGLEKDGGLKLTDSKSGTQTVIASVKLGEMEVKNESIVAAYSQSETVGTLENEKGNLAIAKPTESAWAGTYLGTATFTVSLDTVTS